jgi:hypothetical protein
VKLGSGRSVPAKLIVHAYFSAWSGRTGHEQPSRHRHHDSDWLLLGVLPTPSGCGAHTGSLCSAAQPLIHFCATSYSCGRSTSISSFFCRPYESFSCSPSYRGRCRSSYRLTRSVNGGPCASFGLSATDAALFVALFDVMSFPLLFRCVLFLAFSSDKYLRSSPSKKNAPRLDFGFVFGLTG